LREHYRLEAEVHGEEWAARRMRMFGIKYAEVHPHPKDVRASFVGSWSREAWLAVLERWYDPTRDWPPGRRKTEPGDLAESEIVETA
jgi:hypothetical protein